ncbi:DUF3293 domain-containing protein [Vibrio sp. CAIM 722]|uniref:DUF3293 domain-containing protein n=1 Tax=Vibrio eleionomae TaxID=2653505 RepID=A0A7X4LH32_9VIBR|nr:DUF3293 domain-containing protein [Vibrio eleionomae]MZI91766.1 DUF3293 domain-containing protein [Vibrio eleionomae]
MQINSHLWQAYSSVRFDFKAVINAECYAVITAWNPGSERLSHNENCLNNHRLQLKLNDYDWVSVVVGDPDFQWFEESFAVAMPLEAALDLALTFKQNAIYFVRNGALYLYSCVDSHVVQLGSLEEKLK